MGCIEEMFCIESVKVCIVVIVYCYHIFH